MVRSTVGCSDDLVEVEMCSPPYSGAVIAKYLSYIQQSETSPIFDQGYADVRSPCG